MISLAALVFDDAAQRTAGGHARSDRRWTYSSQRSCIQMIDAESRKTGAERQAQHNDNVRQLAKNMSRWSCNTDFTAEANPFQPPQNSALDPNGSAFEARAWTKAVLALRSKDPAKYAERTAGVAFRDLNAYGFGVPTDYQQTVGNVWLGALGLVRKHLGTEKRKIEILRGLDGIVEAGEMLVVLGPPGSGCTTFLKTISGETHGFSVDERSHLNYQGISAKQMQNEFRGEAIYTAENDVHFPMLTVGQTLYFAARARAPREIPGGVSKDVYAQHMRDVVMATCGILHTLDTNVGNDFARGVSGGERKRVTIAEAMLSQAPLQCWDNSTRGLDAANAIEFARTLRMSTELTGAMACVSIYQASQTTYDLFDKILLLYEGRQIFFGKTTEAKQYFLDLGFDCPARQTDADFLTSMTNPQERLVRAGYEHLVPQTPHDFADLWYNSSNYAQLKQDLNAYDRRFAIGGKYLEEFAASRRAQQASSQRRKSPFTLAFFEQISLCLWRGFTRLRADPSVTLVAAFFNILMALVVSSVFYNLQPTTGSFFQRGALLFFAVLLNAFASALEIITLYAQRPIVEKHARYALYHPSAEAFASMITDIPYKITNSICFNLVLYFMANLRREPGPFFFFLLVSFIVTLVMSMMFRTIASVTRTLEQALAPSALIITALVIYTGFAIPTTYMVGWARWINFINPVAYGFEAIMANEFHNRNFTCSSYVPFGGLYDDVPPVNRACVAIGSVLGQTTVNGDVYLASAFGYHNSHKWRNVGIMTAFLVLFLITYVWSAETVRAKKSQGEVLLFQRRKFEREISKQQRTDTEKGQSGIPMQVITDKFILKEQLHLQKHTATFHWSDITYDIKVKGGTRRLLNMIDGWVKPGTLTALMGESGAGKTTLLDVLASRKTVGIIGGDMLVDDRAKDASFQRKTGYVQQQDLHLQTSTVREALNFSALLRQPAYIKRADRLAYVDEVIELLDMQPFADAVVGVPGEGLNVEQRKRLTIGVELAARPQLLLFLDEPTSGLDSQTSWSICDLLDKLTKNGQAILCTIHQPSAILFQRFDRLLFLAKGGNPVYFGPIGDNASILTGYLERNGAAPCGATQNPAEWMLEVIGAAPGSSTTIDWPRVWCASKEYQEVKSELRTLQGHRAIDDSSSEMTIDAKQAFQEFAQPFSVQSWEVTKRVFQQTWRDPVYIYSKLALCLFSALFIGFSFFKAPNSQTGLQNQMFGIFMLGSILPNLVEQTHPRFVTQRDLYEARERPSKSYSWKSFMLANILVELLWQLPMAVVIFFCWYYPTGLWRNAEATDSVTIRGLQMFLFILQFMIYASTFANATIAGVGSAEVGGALTNVLFSLALIFCGVLATKDQLPGFWVFMYRLSPLTYLVAGMLTTAVADTDLVCATNELLRFDALPGQNCSAYLAPYINILGGYLQPSTEGSARCEFCPYGNTDQYLALLDMHYDQSWRNFGILWVFILFNVCFAFFVYWLVRVPKKWSLKGKDRRGRR
ncbi:probable multidrug resistance protein CDR1 [Phialocephala subalpina]|uniref:Probable multidrug resistance protein CDR1 n=1 Tax=Phialocephala subalpina TaxID=576137 RepID=A0A1L7XL04_9HELO|nr:probable multidrug resistance protein CDR1 [Phialocephala subalpina]